MFLKEKLNFKLFMNTKYLFVSYKNKIYKKFIEVQVAILLFLVVQYFMQLHQNSEYDTKYFHILAYIAGFVWLVLTDKRIRKLHFNNNTNELIITQRIFIFKEKEVSLKYSDIIFKVDNYDKFSSLVFARKDITLFNKGDEVYKFVSDDEFDYDELVKLEQVLIEVKKYNSTQ
jgi:hypothetical protein